MGGNYANNLVFESAAASIIFNTNGGTSNSVPNMIVHSSGNVGIGTLTPNSVLTLFGSTQLKPRITLTGQEFYTGSSTSTEGIAFLLGVNRPGNRQLWLADSANLAVDTTNSVVRLLTNAIDCVATDGLTRLPISIGGAMTITATDYIGIGVSTPQNKLHISELKLIQVLQIKKQEYNLVYLHLLLLEVPKYYLLL